MANRGNMCPQISLIGRFKLLIILNIITLSLLSLGCGSYSRGETEKAAVVCARVELLNGVGLHRLGRAVEQELLRRGFDVYRVGDADSIYEQTVVVDLRDSSGSNAQAVAAALRIRRKRLWFYEREGKQPRVEVNVDPSAFYEVRIIIGKDYKQFFPQAVVFY